MGGVETRRMYGRPGASIVSGSSSRCVSSKLRPGKTAPAEPGSAPANRAAITNLIDAAAAAAVWVCVYQCVCVCAFLFVFYSASAGCHDGRRRHQERRRNESQTTPKMRKSLSLALLLRKPFAKVLKWPYKTHTLDVALRDVTHA